MEEAAAKLQAKIDTLPKTGAGTQSGAVGESTASPLKAQVDDLQLHIHALEQKSKASEDTVEQLKEEIRSLKAASSREKATVKGVVIEPAVVLSELSDEGVYKATGFKSEYRYKI